MRAVERVLVAGACVLALVLGAATVDAQKKKKESFYFEVTEVRPKGDVAQADNVPAWVRAQLARELGKHAVIVTELPAGAPDPQENPKEFKKFLAKRGIRAFKVNVEITSYGQEVQKLEEPRSGHHITVRIALRMFGETVPDRVMAFAGDGSSTIKLEVGKRVRDRDLEIANHDAIELAVAEAVGESLVKLGQPPPGKPVRGKK